MRAAFDHMISNCDYTYEMSDWLPEDFEEWFNESEYTPYDVWEFTDSEHTMIKEGYKEHCDECFDRWFDEKIEQRVIEV